MASNFKKLSDKVKPREQLKAAVSPSELSSESLLAILLKTGKTGCNVMEVATGRYQRRNRAATRVQAQKIPEVVILPIAFR